MNENYIKRYGHTTIIDLVNHIALLYDDMPDKIVLCSSETIKVNVILSKNDLLTIFRARSVQYYTYNKLKLGNKKMYVGTDWVLIFTKNGLMLIWLDVLERIINYLKFINKGGL